MLTLTNLKVSKSGSSPSKTYTTRVSAHFLHLTVYFTTSYKVSLVMKCHAHPDELESVKSGSSPSKTYTTRVSAHFLHLTVYFTTSYKVSLVMKCHAHPDELESVKIGFPTVENLYDAGFSPFSARYRVFHDEL